MGGSGAEWTWGTRRWPALFIAALLNITHLFKSRQMSRGILNVLGCSRFGKRILFLFYRQVPGLGDHLQGQIKPGRAPISVSECPRIINKFQFNIFRLILLPWRGVSSDFFNFKLLQPPTSTFPPIFRPPEIIPPPPPRASSSMPYALPDKVPVWGIFNPFNRFQHPFDNGGIVVDSAHRTEIQFRI